jgi:hypothetical protein
VSKKTAKRSVKFKAGDQTIEISYKTSLSVAPTKQDIHGVRVLALTLLRVSDYAEMDMLGREEMRCDQFGSRNYLVNALVQRGFDVRITVPSEREVKKRRAAAALEAEREQAANGPKKRRKAS